LDKFYADNAVIEADYKCQVVPFTEEYIEKNEDYWQIWRPKVCTLGDKLRETNRIYKKYAGKTYGFLQIPWFIWQRIANIFGFNPGSNWFPKGVICSEVTFDYVQGLGDLHREALPFTLNEVNPDQIYEIVQKRPDLFELVCANKNEI
jgi:hypothetical protein